MEMMKRIFASVIMLSGASQILADQDTQSEDIDRNDPQIVLAYQGDAVVTQKALDAAFSTIPEAHRLGFIRDSSQVDKMVRDLLQTEVLAMDAEAAEFNQDPLVQARMLEAARMALAEAWMDEIVNRAPEADYAALAYEDYLARPENYSTPETLDVTHVLIGFNPRTPEEALELADELKKKLSENPGEFDFMVQEYSDDPGKSSNFGHYTNMSHGQMVKPFEETAFSLQEIGEISNPVRTEFGYHLIRLDARYASRLLSYDQVKDTAEEQVRLKHLDAYRTRYLKNLFSEPVGIPEGSIEIMLKRHFGENLENAPIYTEEGVQ